MMDENEVLEPEENEVGGSEEDGLCLE